MKLMLGEALDILERRDMLVCTEDGMPVTWAPRDPTRKRLIASFLPLIHKAQKFIFDSGSDQDERTVTAVRETAVNMIEAGLFHLPHPMIWIEDPYEDKPDTQRNFYFCVEHDNKITINFMQRIDPRDALPPEDRHLARGMANFIYYPNTLRIDLSVAEDPFQVEGASGPPSPLMEKILGEAVYAVKKFIVALNTDDLVIERVKVPHGYKQPMDKKHRRYEHTIVRVPLDQPEASSGGGGAGGTTTRRKHLVRGYVWGRHTRPVEEQRWIKPFWRGSREVGEVTRTHYVVR